MIMAKPKHGRGKDNLFSRPRRHPPTLRSPSPAVLSALALIATVPPVVAGSPVPSTSPPAFLCPFIERDNIPHPVQVPSGSGLPPAPTPTDTGPPSRCSDVAGKYDQGSDSLWRKANGWTLYGSTCSSAPTGANSDTQSQPSSSQPSVLTPTPTPNNFDTSVLPAGWDSATTFKSPTESAMILALAIVLACFICLLMIGCVIWRRQKKRARDVERKHRRKPGAQDDSQATRSRMRIWAKATARWKSNIRHSARRRRKRHCISSTASRPPSPTCSDSPQLSLVAPRAPSRQASMASEEPDPFRLEVTPSHDDNVTEPSAVPYDPSRPASPPTYGASFAPRFSCPPRSAAPSSSLIPSPIGPDPVRGSNRPSLTDDEPLPYIPPTDGHVATDDKAQLAHIRQLASSPPTSVNAASASGIQPASAPEWHEVEDDLGDLDIHLSRIPTSFHDFVLPPFFPPPPSKTDIPSPFGYLDDHLVRYGEGDDVLSSVPPPEPSHGAFPSAPPADDLGLEPSAPPLEGDDDLFQDWDGASSYGLGVPTSADLDSTARVIESPIPLRASSASRGASIPSILESAAKDSTLPRYHP